MTDTFRALCAELLDELEYQTDWSTAESLKAKASAALAEEPAAPKGREPAAVTGQPSDEEWDALVERVWDKYETVGYQGERFMYDGDFGSALDLVRKELSRWGHQPAPPADGEVAELVTELQSMATDADRRCRFSNAERLSRAAELLQRQALVPVAVSERLPESKDCDADGMCWWWSNVDGSWYLRRPSHPIVVCSADLLQIWLPAHALPLPEVNNG